MVCRKTRKVIFSVAKQLSARLIRHKVRKHCQGKVTIYTDEYSIYRGLKNMLKVKSHKTVTHSKYEYANGEIHANNCENRHSLLRPFLNMYRGISKKNLNNYVKFFQFTHNNKLNWLENALNILFIETPTKRA